jgi:hypothetical protein
VKANRLLFFAAAALLVGLGMLVAGAAAPGGVGAGLGFGDELWRLRRPDLMVQLSLLLVGALGIRALLPDRGEED